MSDGAFEADEAATPDAASKRQSSPLWIDELPFISMLVLALGGAAYASLRWSGKFGQRAKLEILL